MGTDKDNKTIKVIKAIRDFVEKDMLDGVEDWYKKQLLEQANKTISIKKLKKTFSKNNCESCMFSNSEECNKCPYNSPINK